MTRDQVAKAFAEGATKGKNSNGQMYIEGNTIYSYGPHFPIATRTGLKKVSLTTRKYSVTTTIHTSKVRMALSVAGYSIKEVELR